MLRRAGQFFLVALVLAAFGFTGALKATGGYAQLLCFIFIGSSVLSLLFSLFEEPAPPLEPAGRAGPAPATSPGQSV